MKECDFSEEVGCFLREAVYNDSYYDIEYRNTHSHPPPLSISWRLHAIKIQTGPSSVTDRREFLRTVSTTAAAAASGMALSSVAAAQQSSAPAAASPPSTAAEPLPTIAVGKYRFTRLIGGWNPINGNSHQSLNASLCMLQYFTEDRTFEFMTQSEAAGINAWQLNHDPKAIAVIRRMRENGSKVHFICLHTQEEGKAPIKTAAADLGAVAFVHHGRTTHDYIRAGKIELVHDFVKRTHDLGLMAGVSIHNPEHLKVIEDQGWELEFYMNSFYYLSRPREDQQKLFNTVITGEPFVDTDPPKMVEAMRQTDKPCLAYKILAAGRLSRSMNTIERAIDNGFRYAFRRIKPTDAVIVGMFPAFRDELTESVMLTRKYGAPG